MASKGGNAEILTPAKKLLYRPGERFDDSGMVVRLYLNDEKTEYEDISEIDNLLIYPVLTLKNTYQSIYINYKSVIYKIIQAISVSGDPVTPESFYSNTEDDSIYETKTYPCSINITLNSEDKDKLSVYNPGYKVRLNTFNNVWEIYCYAEFESDDYYLSRFGCRYDPDVTTVGDHYLDEDTITKNYYYLQFVNDEYCSDQCSDEFFTKGLGHGDLIIPVGYESDIHIIIYGYYQPKAEDSIGSDEDGCHFSWKKLAKEDAWFKLYGTEYPTKEEEILTTFSGIKSVKIGDIIYNKFDCDDRGSYYYYKNNYFIDFNEVPFESVKISVIDTNMPGIDCTKICHFIYNSQHFSSLNYKNIYGGLYIDNTTYLIAVKDYPYLFKCSTVESNSNYLVNPDITSNPTIPVSVISTAGWTDEGLDDLILVNYNELVDYLNSEYDAGIKFKIKSYSRDTGTLELEYLDGEFKEEDFIVEN